MSSNPVPPPATCAACGSIDYLSRIKTIWLCYACCRWAASAAASIAARQPGLSDPVAGVMIEETRPFSREDYDAAKDRLGRSRFSTRPPDTGDNLD